MPTKAQSITPRDVVRVLDRALSAGERAEAIRAHRQAKLQRYHRRPSAPAPLARTGEPRATAASESELEVYETLRSIDAAIAGDYYAKHADAITEQKGYRSVIERKEFAKAQRDQTLSFQQQHQRATRKQK
jgi:hypothetical protein